MNYREWIVQKTVGIPLLNGTYGPWGQRFVGIMFGLLPDIIAEGASQALKAPWTSLGVDQPTDALPLLGSERRLERYAAETDANYQARLQNAWVTYQYAGTEQSIIEHLTAAGFTNVQIVSYINDPLFDVWFPDGYPLTGGPKHWGAFHWGDGTMYGCQGDSGKIDLIRSIIRKRKAVTNACYSMIFTVGGLPIVLRF